MGIFYSEALLCASTTIDIEIVSNFNPIKGLANLHWLLLGIEKGSEVIFQVAMAFFSFQVICITSIKLHFGTCLLILTVPCPQ